MLLMILVRIRCCAFGVVLVHVFARVNGPTHLWHLVQRHSVVLDGLVEVPFAEVQIADVHLQAPRIHIGLVPGEAEEKGKSIGDGEWPRTRLMIVW